MKTKILITLTLLTALTTLCSCSKEVGRCDLTEAQKQVIPYEKGQVISFTDSAGHTVDFSITERKSEWYKEYYGGGFIEDHVMYRKEEVTLKNKSNNFEIHFWISAGECFGDGHNNSWLAIKIPPYSIYFELFSCDTKGNFLSDRDSIHDSIEINGNVYFDVVETNFVHSNYHKDLQFFYNKVYGILQINIDGENFLTLKN